MERSCGRGPDDLRPLHIVRRYLKHAHGSCLIELGDTRVLCAASMSDSVAQWRRGSGLGWVTAEYSLLPASTHTRSKREVGPGSPSGRTHEIQRLIGRALRSVIDLGGLGGEVTMTVDCDVIQADGGTRTAAITGAFLAAYDALATWKEAGRIPALPVREALAAISVGLVDGEVLLDLDYSEDSVAEVDMNVVVDERGRIVEVQGTAEQSPLDRRRFGEMLDLAIAGALRLTGVQRTMIDEGLDEISEQWA
ncbi:ribonuclease PH [Coriobacteriia bacterium Es71-Z0120]|uniref:ribonuclease PH n=1 Tax=Parvivirga hydrogeniphila TaxID=2939460 RepID=UPI00226090F3|nr:ribonuclease PH [Parvivirga hydrogeniphila]MCL4078756.1 ribonuclease PH [Parvivirga hydrogeniphila]